MKFFITMAEGNSRKKYFPDDVLRRLEKYGELSYNPYKRNLTEDELCDLACDADILLTHWGTPQITKKFLDADPSLKLIAHCAGTVAHIASPDTYDRNIPCLSANTVMAKYVAEAVLGMIIASMRGFKDYDTKLQGGEWTKSLPCMSLLDCTVGLVGLGTVGRNLLDMLAPFDTRVLVYDPYIGHDALDRWSFAAAADFGEVMGADVVSVHASQTPETYHMIDAAAFDLMKEGAVFINTSRGSLVDTQAARAAVERKHLRAAFDVYEKENVPQPGLAGLDGVILQPHTAALPAGAKMTREIAEDIVRFIHGEQPRMIITRRQFERMTQE